MKTSGELETMTDEMVREIRDQVGARIAHGSTKRRVRHTVEAIDNADRTRRYGEEP